MTKLKLTWQQEIYNAAAGIRRRVMEHTIKNNGGYLSQACSSAEIFATLYLNILNIEKLKGPLVPGDFPGVPGPNNDSYFTGAAFNGSKSKTYDRFILSPSQYSLVLYTTLIQVGRMVENGLDEFNKDGGVVEMIGAEHSPGLEIMTGSLGQGISQAAGIALARKLKNETGRVVLFLSDGECQTGQFWEAVQSMSYHKLDNMLAYVDINGYQCDGKMTTVMNIEPFDKRLEAFGARVFRVDGHNVDVLAALGKLKPDGRPTFILCDTDPCRDIDILKKRIPKLHYVRFNSEEERETYRIEYKKINKSAR
ncbi:transketolase [Clostridium estertheticum]|uniref:Transketolase n=1 Tax=Clostridium estertheticum TaxID=238834 RepID=A0AA47ENT6_9CLOT|nr:1-deoxy-D-xylulose-5-phosphate synthase N-terminal domain-containing protein [Clostridium estertheticum]MBU3154553.1 transketolase [Clostridium estertheticum]MBU3201006.1 transketolase [Clostridium estertheticum]WAG62013.1 transketolase [Clostridium estertheticum]WAG63864.1 transketolase [Clostridium estertheticum]